jgi:hypothetical protein
MISSLIGNPRPPHLADKWQPKKHRTDRNQSNASPTRDASGSREQKGQAGADCCDQFDRRFSH